MVGTPRLFDVLLIVVVFKLNDNTGDGIDPHGIGGGRKGRRRQAMTYKRLQLHRDIVWACIVPDRLCKLI